MDEVIKTVIINGKRVLDVEYYARLIDQTVKDTKCTGDKKGKLVAVYLKPERVLENFKFFINGVEAVIKHAEGYSSIEQTIMDIVDKRKHFVAGFVDGVYVGFILIEIIPGGYGCKNVLHINQLYVKPDYDGSIFFDENVGVVEKIAIKSGCQELSFESPHLAWKRKLKDWKIKSVKYKKEIGGQEL